MELRQLRYFVAAAEALNFTEAAKTLYISQSTLSQQIGQLEIDLGMPLFDRIGRKIRLTEAGKLFLPQARKTLLEAEGGKKLVTDLNGIQTGDLFIGVTYGMSALFRATLVEFSEKYPKVKVHVTYATSEALMEQLRQVQLDLVISFVKKVPGGDIESDLLFYSPMELVLATGHPLAARPHIAISELKDVPLALPSVGFTTRALVEQSFRSRKIVPRVEIELNDIDNLVKLVETGKWCAILTKISIQGMATVKSIPISDVRLEVQAAVSWNSEVYRKRSGILFVAIIERLAMSE